METLRVLLDEAPQGGDLPPALAGPYGGGLVLPADVLYANFIASLDGVTTLGPGRGAGTALRGGGSADRFVMGLLRSLADALVVGAGTLRADGRHRWTAGYIDRERADLYRSLGRDAPRLVVVTASGDLDPATRALETGALVLTTDACAARLRGRLSAECAVRSLGADVPAARDIAAAVREEGHRRVLTEGGPSLLGQLLAGGVVDELFLTLAPVLAGRRDGDGRLGVAEGVHLLPGERGWGRLTSVRADRSHLFLRYVLRRSGAE
jgi:riboflavin biosynthesis pyrimidine reductase